MRLGLLLAIASATFPIVRVGRPLPVSRFHVTPPSVDLNNPLPGPPLSLPHARISLVHIPSKRMREFDGSIAMSEQPLFSSVNKTLSQFLPPSTVRNTPRSGCGPYA